MSHPLPLGKGAGGLGRLPYRIKQGMHALIVPFMPLNIAEREAALAILPESARVAFRSLSKGDQRHALHVHHVLVTGGERDTDLLAAALLHDIGKHPGVGITQRSARVLLARWPHALNRLASEARFLHRWRRGMAILLDHAARGADHAAAWGCTPATVSIIRASHDTNASKTVQRLQAADEQ